jgi:hypothetical protein
MLISVLNIKVTCELQKAIKLNYKNIRTHVRFALRVPSILRSSQLNALSSDAESAIVEYSGAHLCISLVHTMRGKSVAHETRCIILGIKTS